jgi:hypothetical protein
MKININFIITCFNREAYWPYLKKVLESYKNISPNIVLCYNGENQDFAKISNVVLNQNSGHQSGEANLIIQGAKYAKKHFDSKLFIKLSIDSWLLNEDIILNIFNKMQEHNIAYAGNHWNNHYQLSSDICFINENVINFFEPLEIICADMYKKNPSGHGTALESAFFHVVASSNNKYLIIPEREPVHDEFRFKCHELNWTMSHSLEENIEYLNKYSNK